MNFKQAGIAGIASYLWATLWNVILGLSDKDSGVAIVKFENFQCFSYIQITRVWHIKE